MLPPMLLTAVFAAAVATSGVAAGPTTAAANLTLPKVLGSHMVLQRAPKRATVWGWASPGGRVTVTLTGAPAVHGVADASGAWSVSLPPQCPAGCVGKQLTITSDGGGSKTLTDVVFGEVLFCSGQSHMTFSINQDMNANATIAKSGSFPGIRMLTVDTATATAPLDDIARAKGATPESSWLTSTPKSFGSALFGYPSAICYYTALHLHQHLQSKVPIGVVAASVGGSAIEFWLSDAARADKTCGGGANISAACPAGSKPPPVSGSVGTGASVETKGWTPGCFWNAMVHPVTKMTIAAILWDQGEADDSHSCLQWGCNLASLGQSWRGSEGFNDATIVLSYDQMKPGIDATGGAGLPQYAEPGGIPNSIFTTRLDLQTCLANATSAGHAVRKLEVGRRLALALRVALLKEGPTPTSFGPSITGATATPLPGGKLLNVSVSLKNAEGLHHVDAPECDGCCHGRTGALIQGSPKTGDGWSFTFSDGTVGTVCKDGSMAECDGRANIRPDFSLDMLVPSPKASTTADAATALTVTTVTYGGVGPWLADQAAAEDTAPISAPAVLKCVYPHGPRFGIEACGLANGVGGYDDHQGIGMAAQIWKATS